MSIRFDADLGIPDSLEPMGPKAWAFTLILIMSIMGMGGYRSALREETRAIAVRLLMAFGLGLAIMSVVFYLLPSIYLGRGVLGISIITAFFALLLLRLAFFKWTSLGIFRARILVLGTGTRAVIVDDLAHNKHAGKFNIIGFMPVASSKHHVEPSRILPPEVSLLAAVIKYRINEIVIAVRDRRGSLPLQELLDCKLRGVRITEVSSFFERERGQVRLESLNASWIVFGSGFRQGMIRETVKRAFDLSTSIALFMLALPIMALTALCIFLESGAPIFYRQERVGQGGATFYVYKFRSMRNDAEKDGKPRWATSNDDRTTRVGKIIRKLRIDELPQLFNTLKGEMSFVGPRPERPFFVNELSTQIPYYQARHSIKPGITGWAQVRYAYGASLQDAVEKLQYDLYYVKNHTLFLDIMILLDTIRVVLRGEGAR